MLSLIQNEVVMKNHWLTNAEFTEIVAISQSTPGPIGINTATYVGYTSVINAGYNEWLAIVGAVIASLSIIWLPFILMICISRYLIKNKDSLAVKNMFKVLRPTIVGLIAAATLMLMTEDNFGSFHTERARFFFSIAILASAFVAVRQYKANPIKTLMACGVCGVVFNYLLGS